MTLVNRLIKEARANPACLRINAGQVREIAAHAHSLMMTTNRPTIEELEGQIRAGKMLMYGIPVRVGGQEMTEWKPAGTAPRDGRYVLVFNSLRNVHVARWGMRYLGDPGHDAWVNDGKYIGGIVTHWMPLPNPPSDANGEIELESKR